MHSHETIVYYIHSRKGNYMVKPQVKLEFIGCIVSRHPVCSQKGTGTYSSAHSFSFRICSSYSDEKLNISECYIGSWMDSLVLDVEEFSDLFWGFTLDHVGHSLASNVTVGQLCTE